MSPHEKIYHDLAERLAVFNWAANARRMGFELDNQGRVEIFFLGRGYLADSSGVHPQSGDPLRLINHRSVLAQYLMSPGYGEPAGSFVPLYHLAGPLGGPGGYERSALEKPLIGAWEHGRADFLKRIAALGGRADETAASPAWTLQVLPKIPMRLVLHEGGDEFSSAAALMYDFTAVNFLEFEFLAVLATILVAEFS